MKCNECILKPFFKCNKCHSKVEYKAQVIKLNDRYKEIKKQIDKIVEEKNLDEKEKQTMLDKVKNIIFKGK